MTVEGWPHALRPLVARFGATEVYCTGIELFGYPPTWEITTKQVAELHARLSG